MGYGTRASGTIRISPPLTAAELRAHPEVAADEGERGAEAYLVREREFTPTEIGEIVVVRGTEIAVSSPDEEFSRYRLVEQVQAIVSAFPNHVWEGHIVLTGEDGGLSAIVVENGEVKEIEPRIVWPWNEGNPELDNS